MIDRVSSAFEDQCYSLCIFLYFSACFDTISRSILFSKFDNYGVRGVALDLIKSYFTRRNQFVEYGNYKSSIMRQDIGAIQGSKCGPLYYDIYTGDIRKICSENEYQMFADDTSLCYTGQNLEALTALVNESLKLVFEWCSFNKLSLNASKCKYMLFTNKKVDSDPFILLDSLPIERVNKFKYLGVHLDDKLKFNKYVDHLCSILSRYCGMTFKLRGHLDLQSAKNTYYSCIHSAIKYCICTYGLRRFVAEHAERQSS